MPDPRFNAVLVTYRRPADLERTLGIILSQTRPPDELIVVDNDPNPETEEIVLRAARSSASDVRYLPMPENAGYTGGLSAGMSEFLRTASDEDWIVACDDDDPPDSPTAFSELLRFGSEMRERDPSTAGVGLG